MLGLHAQTTHIPLMTHMSLDTARLGAALYAARVGHVVLVVTAALLVVALAAAVVAVVLELELAIAGGK